MSWFIPQQIVLPPDFIGFDPVSSVPDPDFSLYNRHLPHWRKEGACYVLTFRLDDSLPSDVVVAMRQESLRWQQRLSQIAVQNDGKIPMDELANWELFQKHQIRKLDSLLDEGLGECVLREPALRDVVVNALHYFEGQRVEMFAFTIMPNHVHVLCRPLSGDSLEQLTGSWKRYTSVEIQGRLRRRGALWQSESFDRIIRDSEHFAQAVRYIARNPEQAGLKPNEATVWIHSRIHDAIHP
jgi:REP element-mobilizing transposase RayT